MMEAIVLAGGFGTRLAQVVKDVPKPMADVAGRPFLAYIMENLIAQGINRIIMTVCYKKEYIMDYFGDAYKGVRIIYSVEETPLFTGGAIKKAIGLCGDDRVLIINGDTFFSVDLQRMRAFSRKKDTEVVIAVKELANFDRYGQVEMDERQIVTAFYEKAPCKKGWINGGIYDLKVDCLEEYPEIFSLENDCFPILLRDKQIYAYPSDGFFIDIGIPEDYYAAQHIFEGH